MTKKSKQEKLKKMLGGFELSDCYDRECECDELCYHITESELINLLTAQKEQMLQDYKTLRGKV